MFKKLSHLRDKPKIFCIGRNKTGTTSLEKALTDLGFQMGDQAVAEMLLDHYKNRNFRPIVDFCRTAQAFQDFPFSLPYTYQVLDYAFPGSKFILSVRNNEDEWYESLVRFHQKIMGLQEKPRKEDLQNFDYRYKGFMWDANRVIYQSPDDDPYHAPTLKAHYLRHNAAVIEYFRFRSDLLVINLAETDAYQRFCAFIGVKPRYAEFPWLNRSL